MSHSIGINPISWSNDDLQYVGGEISLQTCLGQAASAGYDGVELGHKFPRDASELAPLLKEHGLRLVSGWYSGQLLAQSASDEASAMAEHARLLQQMDCEVLIFAEVTGCIHSDTETRLSQRPRIAPEDWPRFCKRLSELAKRTFDSGLKLCYHHHMGTVVQSEEEIDALMNDTSDELYLLLDAGHAHFAGADPLKLARQYAERIGYVHCKDIRASVLENCTNRDCSFLDAVLDGVFTVPGDGNIDFAAILSQLQSAGYDDWFVVEAEQDPNVAPPAKFARLGHDNLRRWLADRP